MYKRTQNTDEKNIHFQTIHICAWLQRIVPTILNTKFYYVQLLLKLTYVSSAIYMRVLFQVNVYSGQIKYKKKYWKKTPNLKKIAFEKFKETTFEFL